MFRALQSDRRATDYNCSKFAHVSVRKTQCSAAAQQMTYCPIVANFLFSFPFGFFLRNQIVRFREEKRCPVHCTYHTKQLSSSFPWFALIVAHTHNSDTKRKASVFSFFRCDSVERRHCLWSCRRIFLFCSQAS